MLASEGGHNSCLQLLISARANLENKSKVRGCKLVICEFVDMKSVAHCA